MRILNTIAALAVVSLALPTTSIAQQSSCPADDCRLAASSGDFLIEELIFEEETGREERGIRLLDRNTGLEVAPPSGFPVNAQSVLRTADENILAVQAGTGSVFVINLRESRFVDTREIATENGLFFEAGTMSVSSDSNPDIWVEAAGIWYVVSDVFGAQSLAVLEDFTPAAASESQIHRFTCLAQGGLGMYWSGSELVTTWTDNTGAQQRFRIGGVSDVDELYCGSDGREGLAFLVRGSNDDHRAGSVDLSGAEPTNTFFSLGSEFRPLIEQTGNSAELFLLSDREGRRFAFDPQTQMLFDLGEGNEAVTGWFYSEANGFVLNSSTSDSAAAENVSLTAIMMSGGMSLINNDDVDASDDTAGVVTAGGGGGSVDKLLLLILTTMVVSVARRNQK